MVLLFLSSPGYMSTLLNCNSQLYTLPVPMTVSSTCHRDGRWMMEPHSQLTLTGHSRDNGWWWIRRWAMECLLCEMGWQVQQLYLNISIHQPTVARKLDWLDMVVRHSDDWNVWMSMTTLGRWKGGLETQEWRESRRNKQGSVDVIHSFSFHK